MDMRYVRYLAPDERYYKQPIKKMKESEFILRGMPEEWDIKVDSYGHWAYCFKKASVLPVQGWKVHITTTMETAQKTLDIVSEYLFGIQVNFKYVSNKWELYLKNSKYGDRSASGKFITVYPIDDGQFEKVVKDLAELLYDVPNEILELPTESQLYYRRVRDEISYMSHSNALCLQEISFGYDSEKEILQDINLNIEIGKTTAIVGSSGAGKTTIFSLIERFYLPVKGKIFYKGVDIEKIELSEWRGNLAYVQQEASIMSGTLYDNLIYGLTNINEDKIWDAIEKTHLKNFIHSLPEGLLTRVGERGIKLSGGQRQRIAIARAMIRDPKILLLDEATAHLDSISEGLVQNALNRLMEGRTTIIIAHRLSTIKNADKIYVLDKGRIIGQGTHKELIYSNEIYRSFIEQQNVG